MINARWLIFGPGRFPADTVCSALTLHGSGPAPATGRFGRHCLAGRNAGPGRRRDSWQCRETP